MIFGEEHTSFWRDRQSNIKSAMYLNIEVFSNCRNIAHVDMHSDQINHVITIINRKFMHYDLLKKMVWNGVTNRAKF